jgi:ribosomal protein S4
MRYPGYMLNPGDMFQVNPERVMYALGKTNTTKPARSSTDEDDNFATEPTEISKADFGPEPIEEAEREDDRTPKQILKSLIAQSKSLLESEKGTLGGKRKQDLRAFAKSVRHTLSKANRETIYTDSLEAQFAEIQSQLRIQRGIGGEKVDALAEMTEAASPIDGPNTVNESDLSSLMDALRIMKENPNPDTLDTSADAMPTTQNVFPGWQPRPYLSAFAFIPRYLEVNQTICAAVYLRHPVARPGLAEVPTPFPESVGTGAFGWYLRRR